MPKDVYTYDELRSMILPLLKKYHMQTASLFGSYARGDADSRSDIDLLVYAGDGDPFNVFGIAEDLHHCSGKKVDVYEISELNPGLFKDTVLREAVAL